jgi:hypothetical protein
MVRRAGDLVNYFVITSISLSLGFANGASYAVATPGASLPALRQGQDARQHGTSDLIVFLHLRSTSANEETQS